MKTARFIAVLALASMTAAASALTVNVSPGGLRDAVADPAAVTELTVSGSLDVTDFDFITMEMSGLRTLDLSGASVAAYSGAATWTGRTQSAADELPEGALMVASLESVTLPEGLAVIGSGALGSSSIQSITLPATLRRVENRAFAECKRLTSVTVPASVTELGESVFAGCTSLENVSISGAVAGVPAGMFRGCVALTSVSLPASAEVIGEEAFAGCRSLESVTFPEGLRQIGSRAFYGAGLHMADLSGCRNLEGIGSWAFASAPGLECVAFPDVVTHIGAGAFFNDGSLLLEGLPEGLDEIADYSLRGVRSAADVSIPEGVTAVGRHAMAGWSGIQMLTLPSTLGSIGDMAMAGWSELRRINAERTDAVPLLGADVWQGVDQSAVTLQVSQDLKEDYENAPQWQDFRIEALQDPTSLATVDGGAGSVGARFEGYTLHITAQAGIAGVQLYDIAGRSFAMPVSGRSETGVSIDTSAWDTPVMIVRVIMSDGSAATMKLSR